MKLVLAELDMLAKDSPIWGARVGALWRHARMHARDEQTRVYPMLREKLTAELEVALSQAYRREGATFLPASARARRAPSRPLTPFRPAGRRA